MCWCDSSVLMMWSWKRDCHAKSLMMMMRLFLVTPILNPRMMDERFLDWEPNLFLVWLWCVMSEFAPTVETQNFRLHNASRFYQPRLRWQFATVFATIGCSVDSLQSYKPLSAAPLTVCIRINLFLLLRKLFASVLAPYWLLRLEFAAVFRPIDCSESLFLSFLSFRSVRLWAFSRF